MPRGDSGPVIHVILECGHIRRYFEATADGMYYCFECDTRKLVKESLTNPRAYQGNKIAQHPDRERYKR